MPNFLLWNVQRKPLDQLVLRLVEQHQLDVVVLVEFPTTLSSLPPLLAQRGFQQATAPHRFGVFARPPLALDALLSRVPGERVGLWRLTAASGRDALLVAVHGQDRRNASDETRAFFFRQVADHIRFLERQLGHKRTLIVGDFNANPFEPALVAAHGLHALGVRRIAERTDRTVGGAPLDFFYNPMWRLFGHGADAASGTHYYHGYNAYELLWHMLDQVIVRPEMVDCFPEDDLRILTSAGDISLLNDRGVPDAHTGSDHLPLFFRWSAQEGGA